MKSKRKITGILGAAAAGMMLASGIVLAAWRVTGRAVNVLSTASFSNRIEEEYVIPSHVDPGQSVDKVVHIKNEGTTDSLVRVKVTAVMGLRDEQGKLVKDETLDPGMLEVEYNTRGWKQLEDGYWYYTGILKAGARTEEPLMKSYWISEQADNRYKDKDGEILVELESIQAGTEALKELWNVDEESLGVKLQAGRNSETVTKVTVKKDQSIKVDAAETDLFANFKNLLPGCSGTQSIKVSNQSNGNVELLLRAEAAEQEKISEEQKALVEKLLSEYAFVEIRIGSRVLYQGHVDGNLKENKNTMKKDISLGKFASGNSGNLVVTLSVSPEMNNDFQKLAGKVNWIFTVVGEDTGKNTGASDNDNTGNEDTEGGSGQTGASGAAYGKEASTAKISPKTGDRTETGVEIFLLGGGFLLMIFSSRKLFGKRGYDRQNG